MNDGFQLGTGLVRDAVPERDIAHQHVVERTVVGLGDKRLHAVELLADDVRPGVFRALHLAALQGCEGLGKRHGDATGRNRLKLRLEYFGWLNTERQALGIGWRVQLTGG